MNRGLRVDGRGKKRIFFVCSRLPENLFGGQVVLFVVHYGSIRQGQKPSRGMTPLLKEYFTEEDIISKYVEITPDVRG
jgi:hypothetical protein